MAGTSGIEPLFPGHEPGELTFTPYPKNEVGFEPTVFTYIDFQDQRLKPLSHSSLK